jgi:hypothetical protein
VSARKIESTTFYGTDGWHDEWSTYLPEGRPVNTWGWSDKDFTTYVREQNRKFKAAGNGTRLRSVSTDDR